MDWTAMSANKDQPYQYSKSEPRRTPKPVGRRPYRCYDVLSSGWAEARTSSTDKAGAGLQSLSGGLDDTWWILFFSSCSKRRSPFSTLLQVASSVSFLALIQDWSIINVITRCISFTNFYSPDWFCPLESMLHSWSDCHAESFWNEQGHELDILTS